MSDYRAAIFAGLFAAVWLYLRLARWNRERRARNAMEAVLRRGLALYCEGEPRVEVIGGVRCLVVTPAKMTLGGPGGWMEGEGR